MKEDSSAAQRALSLARDTMDTLRAYANVPVDDDYTGPIPVDLPYLYGWRYAMTGLFYEFRYRPHLLNSVVELRTLGQRGNWSALKVIAVVRNVEHALRVIRDYMHGNDPSAA